MLVNGENILLLGSILLFASILASKTSYRLGIPTLILFIVVGMLAGSDGIGKIYFDDPKTAQLLGVIALNFILFSGGLDTKWESIRPIVWRGVSLSTIGVLVTAASLGVFVHLISDFSLLEGLLLGSIVSATDAAAVFSILRSRNLGLKGYLRPTLELESGSNDPLAYILTISLTQLIVNGDMPIAVLIGKFFMQMIIGAAMGIIMGKVMTQTINRLKLDAEGLYPVLILSFIFFTYSFTDLIGGTGFLAIYLSGVLLGNSDFLHKKSLLKFYDGQAWLMQIIMFLTLGLLVYPSKILPVVGIGLLISLFLMFIARPLGVFLSLSFFKIKTRDKLFISWVGLRGAVPIVFATYPLLAHIGKAEMIFNIVFFISVSSVLLQGTTLSTVAKWLKVSVPGKAKRRFQLDIETGDGNNYRDAKSELAEIVLPESSSVVGKEIVEIHFPKNASIVMIRRNKKYFIPGGTTVLEKGDKLLIMADNLETLGAVHQTLEGA